MIVADMGSGNTCRNDMRYAEKMIDAIASLDSGRKCILKWQLFEKCGDNIPLDYFVFNHAYQYAEKLGFKTTASVFDADSLDFLLEFEIPFVKIANRRDLDYLIGLVPRKIPIIQSVGNCSEYSHALSENTLLCCVSQYPAKREDYESTFPLQYLLDGISDHISGINLYKIYRPKVYECHFCLEDSIGLDAGSFAKRPKELKEIIVDI